MNNRTLAMLSYVTIIGWLIAFFVKREETDALRKYHLKQGFGLLLLTVAINLLVRILGNTLSLFAYSIDIIAGAGSLLVLILAIIGILNASKEEKKPLPLIGKYCEDKFDFI